MWWIIGFAVFFMIVWGVAIKLFPHTVTWKELLLMLTIQSAIIAIVYTGSLYGKGHDVQILNGAVTNKYSERVSCGHSYSCNCRTRCYSTGKTQSCSTVCDTCYEHSYDVDWIVKSTVGAVDIPRIDRQGLKEPPRFTEVNVGDPFSRTDYYYNYVRAAPFSIFNKEALNSEVVVPEYPKVYDYYKINRVLLAGAKVNTRELNDLLNESLKVLGQKKKVNVVVVLHNKEQSFVEALKTKHLGGKINDVFIAVGLDAENKITMVDVFSWSKQDIVNVAVRDTLLDIGEYAPVKWSAAIHENIDKYYVRRNIEEFAYLDEEVEVPDWVVWFLLIFGTLFPFVSAYIAHKHEIIR